VGLQRWPRAPRSALGREPSLEGRDEASSSGTAALAGLEVPPASFLGAMAVAGAALGPVLDGFHSRFGVLRYHNPPPFPVQVGGIELCQTAIWVPPLFGLAGLLIGALYVLLDAALGTPAERREPGPGRVALGIGLFIAHYYASGLLLGPLGLLGAGASAGPGEAAWWLAGAVELLLWATAVAQWRFVDGSRAGLVVSALTGLGGPAIEVALLNAPGWDLYAYAAPDLLGIPTWIAAVYFCGGPAVGNLARLVLRWAKEESPR